LSGRLNCSLVHHVLGVWRTISGRASIMMVTKSQPNMRMLILSVDKYGYKRDIENDFS
jgi:hypothetical protein